MAEFSQRPEPGSGRWSFLRHLPKLIKRGNHLKAVELTAEEQRIQEGREHVSSLINDLMEHYGNPGNYKEQISGPNGQDGTLETGYSNVHAPWMLRYGPVGYVKLSYRDAEGRYTYVRCSKSGPVSEKPRTEEEKGIIYAGDKGMTADEEMDIWEKWEPSIRAFINTHKANEPST